MQDESSGIKLYSSPNASSEVASETIIGMSLTVESAISSFGAAATAKLSNVAVGGNPEDQLRAPFERLLIDMASLSVHGTVTAVGESALSHLGLRPDYAVTVANALTGFVELKAPGKGADPRSFTNPHDKEQGKKLLSLPNVLFTDGNGFSLWQNGEIVGKLLTMNGDVRSSGAKLAPPPGLQVLFEAFLSWKPSPPSSAKELAHTTARLCRFLRDEAVEQLARKSPALTSLAQDWRKLLFPEATDERFADGYAQAVTFGLLMARAKSIILDDSLQHAADELSQTSTLIGAALHLLTEDPDNRKSLKTSLSVLIRVLNAVDWNKIAKGNSDTWLYFYEEFLATYDNKLRKLTGSYYTPPEVVEAMVALVDEALRSPRFNLYTGLASPAVTIADRYGNISARHPSTRGQKRRIRPGGRCRSRCNRRRTQAHHRLRDAARPIRCSPAPHPRRGPGPHRFSFHTVSPHVCNQHTRQSIRR
jgi:hypothetical protein